MIDIGITKLKNQIFKWLVILTGICWVISLPILKWNIQFLYGLALGAAISIVNFTISAYMANKMLTNRKTSYYFLGYLIRLIIYGYSFYTSMQVGYISGIGTAIGFVLLIFSIYIAKIKIR